VAILGMMGELGADGPRYHSEVAEYARTRADVMVGVGSLAVHYEPDHWFGTSTDCARRIQEIIRPGDVVLVKGSHFLDMGLITESLEEGLPGITSAEDAAHGI
jgi:UDP-N-acetylmuramoyl-tripeptide--D-alanyl-D-alanine ligase